MGFSSCSLSVFAVIFAFVLPANRNPQLEKGFRTPKEKGFAKKTHIVTPKWGRGKKEPRIDSRKMAKES